MDFFYKTIGRKALFTLDAETAHGASIAGLKAGLHPRADNAADPRLAVTVAGLTFPNPLGMAAGYDKGADVPHALMAMGFGHAEVGTITPKPQGGNPKPRVFRLLRDDGVINRLGFNSEGHEVVRNRLARHPRVADHGILGINLGANKTSEDFAADYVMGVKCFAPLADYLTVNISSPNTPGLRALQGADPLADLLDRVADTRDEQDKPVPLFLKIAPDLDQGEMEAIAKALQASRFDGLIVSNTTLARTGLKSVNADETGGVSGRPLMERSTIALARMARLMGADFPLIGVGGVFGPRDAITKIEAGAHLVQLYTGLIYGGPNLPGKIIKGMGKHMDALGVADWASIRGSKTDEWAAKTIPA
ncbi:MAG: quinone-dependent dihydroorotate dehydrogenase [Pseudomonadota bacterium]